MWASSGCCTIGASTPSTSSRMAERSGASRSGWSSSSMVAASEGTGLVWRSMDTEHGAGWAIGSVDGLGSGPGFRKIRSPLGVTAFGVNAIVLPPAYATNPHHHERQQELYIVLDGEIELTLGGEARTLGPGGLARVDPATVRSLRNTSSDREATYLCVGGAGGYVGRDGVSDAGG